MGGGKGSGSGSGASGPPKVVKRTMRDQSKAAKPVLNEIGAQILEALQTGGVNARIPIMQRTVEAGRHASAQASQNAENAVARGNYGPYGRMLTENVAQQGEFNTSQSAMQVIQQLMNMAPDFGLLRGSGAFGASGTVTKSDEAGQFEKIGGTLAAIVGTIAKLYAGCHVALALYGRSNELKYARWWICFAWKGRTANVVRRFYIRYSAPLAEVVRRSCIARALAKPLFDIAVRKGMEAW